MKDDEIRNAFDLVYKPYFSSLERRSFTEDDLRRIHEEIYKSRDKEISELKEKYENRDRDARRFIDDIVKLKQEKFNYKKWYELEKYKKSELKEKLNIAEEVLSDIKLLVHNTEELNMDNYDEFLVSNMNDSFIAISEALSKLKDKP